MTGIDTNILVRYLVEDDLAQTEKVHRLFGRLRSNGEAIYISSLVICESIWVLQSVYGKTTAEVIEIVEELLGVDVLKLENEDVVRLALAAARNSKAGFADHLIGQLNLAAGCSRTVTFDRALRRTSGFALL